MDIELLKKILMDNRRIISRIEFIKRDHPAQDCGGVSGYGHGGDWHHPANPRR